MVPLLPGEQTPPRRCWPPQPGTRWAAATHAGLLLLGLLHGLCSTPAGGCTTCCHASHGRPRAADAGTAFTARAGPTLLQLQLLLGPLGTRGVQPRAVVELVFERIANQVRQSTGVSWVNEMLIWLAFAPSLFVCVVAMQTHTKNIQIQRIALLLVLARQRPFSCARSAGALCTTVGQLGRQSTQNKLLWSRNVYPGLAAAPPLWKAACAAANSLCEAARWPASSSRNV